MYFSVSDISFNRIRSYSIKFIQLPSRYSKERRRKKRHLLNCWRIKKSFMFRSILTQLCFLACFVVFFFVTRKKLDGCNVGISLDARFLVFFATFIRVFFFFCNKICVYDFYAVKRLHWTPAFREPQNWNYEY